MGSWNPLVSKVRKLNAPNTKPAGWVSNHLPPIPNALTGWED